MYLIKFFVTLMPNLNAIVTKSESNMIVNIKYV